MEGGKTISVVMATYNGAAYVPAQLDSILNQTLPPDEILVVDDVSQDETWAILQDYASRYPTIRIIRNEKNMGAYANFKQAFKLAKGDLIAPSDQDDIWMPEKLERLKKAIEFGEYDIAYTYDRILYEDGTTKDHRFQITPLYLTMWRNFVFGHTMLFRKEIMYIFDLPGKLAFDLILSIYGSISGKTIAVDYIGSLWRRHKGVATIGVSSMGECLIRPKKRGKWGRVFYTIAALLCNEKNDSIAQTCYYRYQFISYFAKGNSTLRPYARLMYHYSKQTVFSFCLAGVNNIRIQRMLLQYKDSSLLTRIRRAIFAFEHPFLQWYDDHLQSAFD